VRRRRRANALTPVPILARRWAGRKGGFCSVTVTPFWFQSSPDPEAGRNKASPGHNGQEYKFQSSPDPKAKRNFGMVEPVVLRPMFQSSSDLRVGRNGSVRRGLLQSRIPILARPVKSRRNSAYQSCKRNAVRKVVARVYGVVGKLARASHTVVEGRANTLE